MWTVIKTIAIFFKFKINFIYELFPFNLLKQFISKYIKIDTFLKRIIYLYYL